MKRKLLLLVVIIFFTGLLSTDVQSQDFGIYPAYNSNRHEADFRQIGLSPDTIPALLSGTNPGFTLGLYYDYRLNRKLTLRLLGSYTYNNAFISGDLPNPTPFNGSDTGVLINYLLKANLSSVEFSPEIRMNFVGDFMLILGLSAGYRFSDNYNIREIIKTPGINFPNGTNTQTTNYTGQNVAFQAAISIGVGYSFYIDNYLQYKLTPDIKLVYGFAKLDDNFNTDITTMRIGVSLSYNPKPKYLYKQEPKPEGSDVPLISGNNKSSKDSAKIIMQIVAKDTSEKKKKADLALSVYTVKNGVEQKTDNLQMNETISSNILPVLNYVFFDKNSSQIPDRYRQLTQDETSEFSVTKLHNLTTLEKYQNILNVIGYRMLKDTTAAITLTGCNSGEDEKNDQKLSLKRSNSIKDYLINSWNINPDRIKCEKRNLPKINSGLNDSLSKAENRRVEINSDNPNILELLTTTDTLLTFPDDKIRIKIMNGNDYPGNWILNVNNKGNTIMKFSGKDTIPHFIDWKPTQEEFNGIDPSYPLQFSLSSDETVKAFQPVKKEMNLNIEKSVKNNLTDDKNQLIENYSLILFGFNSSALSAKHIDIITYLNSRIFPDSKIIVEGHTDIIGDSLHNQNLSTERAINTYKAIKKANENVDGIFMGMGYSGIYDNLLPEGRFYSRTVIIRVITPKK